MRRDQFGKTLRYGSQLTSGTQVFIGRADDQLALLCGEGPVVPVHAPLAGAGALRVKLGEQGHYFGLSGHGVFLPWLAQAPMSRHRGRLPVMRVPTVWTDAVQRPACEPALIDPIA
jgi:hypothetical protein